MSIDSCVIDGQVFQSKAWDRGMGKYSLSLLAPFFADKKNPYKTVYVIFTKEIPLKKQAEDAIRKAIPEAQFVFLALKVPSGVIQGSVSPLITKNTAVLDEWAKSTNIKAFDFIILSLFLDEVCSTFPVSATRNILLFYDLIPLQYHTRYGKFANYNNYLRNYKTLMSADILWTISQTVADDLVTYTGISPRKIYNINGAPIKRTHNKISKPKNIEIPERYVLMPSGDDPRKNNERAVRAVERYNSSHDDKVSVLITSFFTEGARNRLRSITSDAIFTGNVSEGELLWLYKNAKALLFVPEYEGLGLPILEAMEVGLPIVSSNLTVFDEMSPTVCYSADGSDPLDIAKALESALEGDGWEQRKAEYPSILKRYSWTETAKAAVKSLIVQHDRSAVVTTKKRIAIFTPDPAGYSAIGKFNIQLHPALSRYFEIDYYVEKAKSGMNDVRPSYLGSIANVFDASSFSASKYRNYDAVVYHIGNSEFHIETVRNALYLPGYAIFHDTNLEGLFKRVLEPKGYMSSARIEAEEVLNSLLKTEFAAYVGSLVNTQLGIISHSTLGTEELKKTSRDSAILHETFSLPVGTPRLKRRRGSEGVKVAFAGIIAASKGLELIDQISQSDEFSDVHIYVFGIPFISEQELQRLKSLAKVTLLTDLTDFEFQSKLSEMDILVNYRSTYNGEASASTLEAMRLGVVPIVRDIGWFSELSKKAVMHVKSHTEVLQALRVLSSDRSKLATMSDAAMQETSQKFNYELYADNLIELLNKKIKQDSLNGRVRKLLLDSASKTTIQQEIQKVENAE